MKRIMATLLFILMAFSYANTEIYVFTDSVEEKRFKELTRQLRCPKCQNQNIADSNSPQAEDLRNYTYEMIKDGRADNEIVQFMVQRYGDFATYKPPMKPVTWALWFSPAIVLLCILFYIFFLREPRVVGYTEEALTDQEKAEIKEILDKY